MQRRSVLALFGTALSTGCLRLGPADEETATSAGRDVPDTDDGTPTQSEPLAVTRFYADSPFEEGELRDPNTLPARAGDRQPDFVGSWEGQPGLFGRQFCANYSFDMLENGAPIASSATKTLIHSYVYRTRQTEDSLFITYQPSVNEAWDPTVVLSYSESSYRLKPTIRPEEGVFEVDLSGSDVPPGRYRWGLEITPQDETGPTGLSLNIGNFSETLISVKPDQGEFLARDAAITQAGRAANDSAISVRPPDDSTSDGLTITGSGVGGGTANVEGLDDVRETSQGFSVLCEPPLAFGGGAGRRLRINNVTTGESLTFTPDA